MATMMMSDNFKHRYVAPEVSTFTTAEIPELSDVSREQTHWLLNFILNSAIRVRVDDSTRSTLFNFLRRTEAAFREYAEARSRTLAHLSDPRPNAVSDYIRAIDHWEQFLLQADRAWTVSVRGQPVLFAKNDGSVLQRLNYLYNLTKHLDSAIRSNPPVMPSEGTMPMWLRNDGCTAFTAASRSRRSQRS